jgi:DNA-binding LacI/PurR family transcriptional regulator
MRLIAVDEARSAAGRGDLGGDGFFGIRAAGRDLDGAETIALDQVGVAAELACREMLRIDGAVALLAECRGPGFERFADRRPHGFGCGDAAGHPLGARRAPDRGSGQDRRRAGGSLHHGTSGEVGGCHVLLRSVHCRRPPRDSVAKQILAPVHEAMRTFSCKPVCAAGLRRSGRLALVCADHARCNKQLGRSATGERGMVTIKDIAEETGLSPATVARALGDNGPARPETRAKVREAAERLGYVASSAARSMRRQSSNMLGLVVPDIANRFYSEMARIMAAACDARGLHFLLAVTDDDPNRELQQMRAMVAARVAAVALVPGPDTRPELKALASRQPFTQLVRRSRELPTDWFGFDEEEGLRQATEHLLDLGHRHILLACSADRYSTGGARQKGFREAYARRGLAVDADLIRTGAPTVHSGRAAVADIPSHVTAIIAAGTMLTEGAADALSRSGRQYTWRHFLCRVRVGKVAHLVARRHDSHRATCRFTGGCER